MDGPSILAAITVFVALLGVAAVVAIVVRPLRLPYTVALVVVGLVAGIGETLVRPGNEPTIAPEIVLVVLLPGLVFEAGYRLDLAHLRRQLAVLVFLAMPGVLISASVVAVLLHLATGLRFDLAFIVGAMVSATDPAAVVATFRRLPVPAALATVVEGESLLNDGTGLVVFGLAVGAVAAPISAGDALVQFSATIAISGVIGVAAGFVAARVLAIVDDHLIELTISVVLAYGTYLAADAIHQSGIIATVLAAIVLGNYGRGWTLSPGGIDALDTVWEFLAYLLTALVFLLVGLAFPIAHLVDSVAWIAWGVVGTLVGRALAVYVVLGGATALPFARDRAVPIGWFHVLFWAGLRGAVAVAMALALPATVPQRELLQEITFGIVLFTVVVQGSTAAWVVRRAVGPATEADLPVAGSSPPESA